MTFTIASPARGRKATFVDGYPGLTPAAIVGDLLFNYSADKAITVKHLALRLLGSCKLLWSDADPLDMLEAMILAAVGHHQPSNLPAATAAAAVTEKTISRQVTLVDETITFLDEQQTEGLRISSHQIPFRFNLPSRRLPATMDYNGIVISYVLYASLKYVDHRGKTVTRTVDVQIPMRSFNIPAPRIHHHHHSAEQDVSPALSQASPTLPSIPVTNVATRANSISHSAAINCSSHGGGVSTDSCGCDMMRPLPLPQLYSDLGISWECGIIPSHGFAGPEEPLQLRLRIQGISASNPIVSIVFALKRRSQITWVGQTKSPVEEIVQKTSIERDNLRYISSSISPAGTPGAPPSPSSEHSIAAAERLSIPLTTLGLLMPANPVPSLEHSYARVWYHLVVMMKFENSEEVPDLMVETPVTVTDVKAPVRAKIHRAMFEHSAMELQAQQQQQQQLQQLHQLHQLQQLQQVQQAQQLQFLGPIQQLHQPITSQQQQFLQQQQQFMQQPSALTQPLLGLSSNVLNL
ncbi:hypothetical protein GQ42DRAFT_155046 [Ramicandelaber brevisporus]|nr:hypothetical protein GQ42DRAFT_155046 [Ramicandelaber brevisporus]